MSGIQSNAEQFAALEETAQTNEKPVVMLNLLKFKQDGGPEAYLRYVSETGPFVKAVGAEVLFFGKTGELLYGDETWDAVLLVRYPSRKAFLEMASNPDYLKTHAYRVKALERAVLYATDPATYGEIVPKKTAADIQKAKVG